jgi:hypothetical protein
VRMAYISFVVLLATTGFAPKNYVLGGGDLTEFLPLIDDLCHAWKDDECANGPCFVPKG